MVCPGEPGTHSLTYTNCLFTDAQMRTGSVRESGRVGAAQRTGQGPAATLPRLLPGEPRVSCNLLRCNKSLPLAGPSRAL